MTEIASRPVVFGYDGSELAKLAIEQAGGLLRDGQPCLVVCVWQPYDVGFEVPEGRELDAQDPAEIRKAAEGVAAEGAALAVAAGFGADSLAIEDSQPAKAIVALADERDAAAIVIGSHGRTGLAELLLGSVAKAVATHSERPVLITHRQV